MHYPIIYKLSDHQSYSSTHELFQIHFDLGGLYDESTTEERNEVIMLLTVYQCLLNFILRGHHERTVLHNLLFERLSRDLRVVR